MGLDVARKASDIRAGVRIKAPDAIQIATAIVHGATAFLTNDRIFEKVKEIDVLTLDKFLKS
jgi:predicted nucleic acid-binding protein